MLDINAVDWSIGNEMFIASCSDDSTVAVWGVGDEL